MRSPACPTGRPTSPDTDRRYARDTRDPAFQELYTRWFEFGVFCPIFRTHGHRANNENRAFHHMDPSRRFSFAMTSCAIACCPTSIRWRGRSPATTPPSCVRWSWTGGPIRRGLEYRRPVHVRAAISRQPRHAGGSDQPRLSICRRPRPGTTSGQEKKRTASRGLKRPRRSIESRSMCVPDRSFPWVRKSSTQDKSPAAPIELRIYRGADGDFDLYEDAGDTYDYEKGEHSIIPIAMERLVEDPDHRRTCGIVSDHVESAHIRCRLCKRKSWRRSKFNGAA